MVVNVSQSPYLFDESLQVCKFAAIASKVIIEVSKEPEQEVVVAAKAATKRNRRQSNYSMIVDKKVKESLLTGQGSFASEQAQICSTLCPMSDEASAMISEDNETVLSDSFSPFQVTAMKATHNQKTPKHQKLKEQVKRESFDLSTAR
jgi:hypothetical protein